MLVLQTRPHGVAHAPLSSLIARLTDRYLRSINPDLVELRRTRSSRYDALTAELANQAADPARVPSVCVIRPPAGAVVAGQLENRATVLQRVAAEGMRAAWMAFTGEDPELISALRAYPAVSEATAAARGRPDPRIGDSIVERAKP
jgi:hypothetical protein